MLFLVVELSQPESDFACVNHLGWAFKDATKFIVNIFFNNKQTVKGYCQ